MPRPKLPKVQVDIDKIKVFLQTDRAMLMGCIGIAFVVWFFMKMSQTHATEIPIEIAYKLPEDKIFATPPPTSTTPKINGTGWALLSRYIRAQRPDITLDIDNKPNQTIGASRLETLIQRQLPAQLNAGLYAYQSISVQLDDKAGKLIPLILKQGIRTSAEYQLVVPPRLVPDSIMIYGPKGVIDTTKNWTTEYLKIEDVKENMTPIIKLKPHSNTEVTFESVEVICRIDVERFTEKTLEIPTRIINAPDSLLLTIHPSRVKVICRVGHSNYDKVEESQFEAVADFTKVDINNSNYAPVKLTRQPGFVKITGLLPKDVEFIISR